MGGVCCKSTSTPLNLHELVSTREAFHLENQVLLAVCTKVIDGDTLVLKFVPEPGSPLLLEERVRLAGIDCPESYRPTTSEEKRHGLACKEMMKFLVENKVVLVSFGKRSKFGYPLVDLNTGLNGAEYDALQPSLHVNTYMLDNTPSLVYRGEKKSKAFVYARGNSHYKQILANM